MNDAINPLYLLQFRLHKIPYLRFQISCIANYLDQLFSFKNSMLL